LGWVARGQMNDDSFDEAAFALQPGEMSGVVALSYGYALIEVLDRQTDMAFTESQLSAAQDRALEDWYNTQRNSVDVVRSWDSTMVPVSE